MAIFNNRTDGPGFVVSYVPESDVKPHGAEFMEGKPYMLRIGDSFQNPSPSILRNLFFPRSSARLQIGVHADWQGIELRHDTNVPGDIGILFRMTIYNAGVVSAKDVFVIVDLEPLALEIEIPYGATKTATESGVGLEFTRLLHPSSHAPLCAVRQRVNVGTRTSTGEKHLVPRPTTFAVTFQVVAADMQRLKLRASLSDWDIDHKRRIWAMPSGGNT